MDDELLWMWMDYFSMSSTSDLLTWAKFSPDAAACLPSLRQRMVQRYGSVDECWKSLNKSAIDEDQFADLCARVSFVGDPLEIYHWLDRHENWGASVRP